MHGLRRGVGVSIARISFSLCLDLFEGVGETSQLN